jgi:Domain of unknown function (DUF4352)
VPPTCDNCGRGDFLWANEVRSGSGALSLRPSGEISLGARICRFCGRAELFLHNTAILHRPQEWQANEFVPIPASSAPQGTAPSLTAVAPRSSPPKSQATSPPSPSAAASARPTLPAAAPQISRTNASSSPPPPPPQPPRGVPPAPLPKKKRTGVYVAVIVVVLLIIVVVAVAASHSSLSSPGQSISIAYTTQVVQNASPGNEILIVNMTTIHDKGYSSFFVNPATFELTTGGVSYSDDPSTFELTYALQATGVTLQSGGTTSGAIAFLIPSGSSGYIMSYSGGSYNFDWVNDGSSSSVAVTITTSISVASSIGSNFPTPGNEYLIVNMTIKDEGYSSFEVSPVEFTASTAGVAHNYDDATFSLNNTLQDVELQSGEIASGGVAFQVPLGSTGSTFSYSTGASGLYYNVNWVSA